MGAKKKKYVLERNYRPVGLFLKEAREKAGLTQREVSDALGYSSSQFISNFEAGIAVPPLNKLALLVPFLKMNAEDLLDVILTTERELMLAGIQSQGSRVKK